ncbi:MAG: YlbF family regulator [Clostridia bacterium]|nr:YlbF family regulator [Clostridia bacterium]
MQEILELAKKLGSKIADSEELKTYKEMEKIYFESESAQKSMKEYESTRANMAVKAQEMGMTQESMEIFETEMQKAMEKLTENKTVKEYLDAQAAFSDIITKVNSIIAYYVQGEEQNMAAQSSGGCSGNCSSCRGCH